MSTETNLLKQILTKSGGNADALPDNLLSTHYEAIIKACGGSVDDLPDRLTTTYLKRIAEVCGGSADNSIAGTWVFNDTLTLTDFNDTSVVYSYHKASTGTTRNCVGMMCIGDVLTYCSSEFNDGHLEVYYGGAWKDTYYKTITITEEPTNEAFIAWLKANATKQESVIGTWVFNEVITCPDKNYYEVKFTSDNCDYAVIEYNSESKTFYYSVEVGDETDPAYQEYEGNYVWSSNAYKTITITEEPTDPEFIVWLKANAVKQKGVVGVWRFNDTLTQINKPFDEGFKSVAVKGMYIVKDPRVLGYIYFIGSAETLEEFGFGGFSTIDVSSGTEDCAYYSASWASNVSRAIAITEEPTDEAFIAWLRVNAVRLG